MTRFVAEIGANHNGDYGRACALVDTAAAIGCAAVKPQYWRIDRLYAPEAIARMTDAAGRRALELPLDWLAPLAARARGNGMEFGCSVFDVDGLCEILQAVPDIDFLKVSSYSILDKRLLHAVALAGRPVVLSTGLATDLGEVSDAVEAVGQIPLLLHCVSQYPVRPSDCALQRIAQLRWVGVRSGWSDHSVSPAVIYAAVLRWQADMVECHLDLDGEGKEGADHCWLPDDLESVIATVALAEETADFDAEPTANNPEVGWRADPSDGLRPLLALRAGLSKTNN